MTNDTIPSAAADDPHAALSQHLHGDGDDDMLRRFAEAHDREEAAQIGEPSPWDSDDLDPDWIEARLSCVRAGLAATDWRTRALAAEAEVERLRADLHDFGDDA